MATHSSILAWKTQWTEEPGGLQSMGRERSDVTERVRTHVHTHMHAHINTIITLLNKDIYVEYMICTRQ